ncbi:MAG TPA: hypothetical protein VI685_27875 [Candidatus Angelobacter sp.]
MASLLCFSVCAVAQTADELVDKNLQAKGGLEKIRAIKSMRMTAVLDAGGFKVDLGQESERPNLLRQTVSLQGMTQVTAYDGNAGWQIDPFQGRKDPEMVGDEQLRSLVEDADFDGPLVDAQAKGNKIEYIGHDQVDGDDVYKLKVTLKNGDIFYYSLDPDTYIEIQIEKQRYVRGAVRESVTLLGSYKPVNGVMFPFSIVSGPKNNPEAGGKVTVQKIEANVTLDDKDFKMPAALESPKTGSK